MTAPDPPRSPRWSIVIPAYDEAVRLPGFLKDVLAYFEGRDETFGLARKLRTQVRDIDVVWRETFLTEGSKSATEPTVAAMRALGPYYFEPE